MNPFDREISIKRRDLRKNFKAPSVIYRSLKKELQRLSHFIGDNYFQKLIPPSNMLASKIKIIVTA